ncbi:MAG: DNA-deoxyinosine glycosylase [Alphaproteobacteria bacterium]
MSTRKSAFAPVAGRATRVLILGSLPGEASLAAQQYYAHPRNLFWRLIGAVIDEPNLPTLAYPQRLEQIAARGIGLWDVIASAQRSGSLDAAIRGVEAAPLADLAASLPGLQAIAFNGAKSAALGRKALAETGLPLIDLPSSSPANATLRFEEKRARWMVLKDFLV